MNDFSKYLKNNMNLKQKKEDKEKEISKDKLLKVAKRKIQTTMIGSLASIEHYLGFLWSEDNPSPEQIHLKKIFEELRSEILDRGNTQIRNLENEFVNYEVVFKKYTMNLPFINNRGRDN